MKLGGLTAGLLVVGIAVVASSTATVACGPSCSSDAQCPSALCCGGVCVPSDDTNCGQCGASCLFGTKCETSGSATCVGSGTSACAITRASRTDTNAGPCDFQASWQCISDQVSCHCDGTTPGGTCACPGGRQVAAPFMCPTCDVTFGQLTQLATLCNVSAPTP